MPRYANRTQTSSEKTRNEIERLVIKYGATGFMYFSKGDHAAVAFELGKYHIRVDVPLPKIDDDEFMYTPSRGKERTPEKRYEIWEQACRERWRAIALIIKAKLVAIEQGIRTVEQEFLSDIVVNAETGQTAGQVMIPQLQKAVVDGKTPRLAIPWGGE